MAPPASSGSPVEVERPAAGPDGADLAGNKATARVLIVLTRLATTRGSCGVSELSRELGMTKNMVHRALQTLVHNGYATRDEGGSRYRLGPGVFRLGGDGLPDLDLPELARPALWKLRDLAAETTTLAVPVGRRAVTVAGARGPGAVARRIPLGRTVPLHISVAARAILAHFPDDEIDRYLEGELERRDDRTLTTSEEVRAEVAAVRERGYATSFDHAGDARGIAFGIRALGEHPHGSITVAGPAQRFTQERVDELLPELRAVVERLCAQTELYGSAYLEASR